MNHRLTEMHRTARNRWLVVCTLSLAVAGLTGCGNDDDYVVKILTPNDGQRLEGGERQRVVVAVDFDNVEPDVDSLELDLTFHFEDFDFEEQDWVYRSLELTRWTVPLDRPRQGVVRYSTSFVVPQGVRLEDGPGFVNLSAYAGSSGWGTGVDFR